MDSYWGLFIITLHIPKNLNMLITILQLLKKRGQPFFKTLSCSTLLFSFLAITTICMHLFAWLFFFFTCLMSVSLLVLTHSVKTGPVTVFPWVYIQILSEWMTQNCSQWIFVNDWMNKYINIKQYYSYILRSKYM